jgi:hypothetical protein
MTMIQYRMIAAKFQMSRWISRAFGLALLFALALPLLNSQKPGQGNTTTPLPPPSPSFIDQKAPDYGPPPTHVLTIEDKQYLSYFASRLKSMASDSDKLQLLAKELNAKIEKSGTGSLSREDLRTVAEIEKLAHNVKWKMQLAAEASSGP